MGQVYLKKITRRGSKVNKALMPAINMDIMFRGRVVLTRILALGTLIRFVALGVCLKVRG